MKRGAQLGTSETSSIFATSPRDEPELRVQERSAFLNELFNIFGYLRMKRGTHMSTSDTSSIFATSPCRPPHPN
ncbi:hypothetical protein C1141_19545 [Vibrio agarivorans]|nr:hypothetical protein C1141_19545 [Vibrio agarivorans]